MKSRKVKISVRNWWKKAGVIALILLCTLVSACGKDNEKNDEKEGVKDTTKGERYEKVLSKEVIEKYKSEVTYEQLIEDPEEYKMKTTVIMYGKVREISEDRGEERQVIFDTEDGALIGVIADKEADDINVGDEYVLCGQFEGMDVLAKNVPLVQVLVLKSLEGV